MSSVISQASCFSATYNKLHLRNRSHPHLLRSKVLMMVNNNGHALKVSTLVSKSVLSCKLRSHNDILGNSSTVEYVNGEEINEPTENVIPEIGEPVKNIIPEQQRSAKIHDFCFGLPYGGIVFSGGVISFILSRNPASLITGGLYGGFLLALSILSLKVWRQGQSSSAFIIGQLGLAAALLWKNIQTYSLTKKILPTGFNIVLSTAMVFFYTYVIVSGGNPPKKLKSPTAASES